MSTQAVMGTVKIVKREDGCPRCKFLGGLPKLARAQHKDFECQVCGNGFCGGCFIAVAEKGDGHTCQCPNCETELLFP